jgi:hypothetical protein
MELDNSSKQRGSIFQLLTGYKKPYNQIAIAVPHFRLLPLQQKLTSSWIC